MVPTRPTKGLRIRRKEGKQLKDNGEMKTSETEAEVKVDLKEKG